MPHAEHDKTWTIMLNDEPYSKAFHSFRETMVELRKANKRLGGKVCPITGKKFRFTLRRHPVCFPQREYPFNA